MTLRKQLEDIEQQLKELEQRQKALEYVLLAIIEGRVCLGRKT